MKKRAWVWSCLRISGKAKIADDEEGSLGVELFKNIGGD
jgi:hypothetical protein